MGTLSFFFSSLLTLSIHTPPPPQILLAPPPPLPISCRRVGFPVPRVEPTQARGSRVKLPFQALPPFSHSSWYIFGASSTKQFDRRAFGCCWIHRAPRGAYQTWPYLHQHPKKCFYRLRRSHIYFFF